MQRRIYYEVYKKNSVPVTGNNDNLFHKCRVAEGVISAELDGTISKTQLPFAEDRVLVVLKPEVGNKLTTHNVADFLGIGCKSVTNLTAATSAIIEAKINGTVTRGIDGSIIDIDVVGYQKILCLELNEGGHR